MPEDGRRAHRRVLRQHRRPRRRHLAPRRVHRAEAAAGRGRRRGIARGGGGAEPAGRAGGRAADEAADGFRWLMASDVCKHCTHAACLEVCPTGALFRTEFGTVVVQPDMCNGCGYCVPACPFGVIDRREEDGRAWKCTLCYDRLKDDHEPACAQACPTESIQFGELDELRERAQARVEAAREAGTERGAALRRRPGRRRRRLRRVLPAARRARGLRAAAGPAWTRRATSARRGRRRRWRRWRWPRAWPRRSRRPAVSAGSASGRWSRARSRAPTTAGRSSRRPCGPGRSRCTSSSAAWPGASAVLGELAEPARRRRAGPRAPGRPRSAAPPSARRCWSSDLGRPERFLNMLRVFKVTSPMSVGSWILAAFGPAAGLAAANAQLGLLPRLSRPAGLWPRSRASCSRPTPPRWWPNTAVPVWRRRGAAAVRVLRRRRGQRGRRRHDPHARAPRRRGAAPGHRRRAGRAGAARLMERRLGRAGRALPTGPPGRSGARPRR